MSSKPGDAGHANSFHDWFFYESTQGKRLETTGLGTWDKTDRSLGAMSNSEAGLEPSALSPEIAISEAAFERELEEEVTIINATKDEAVLRTVTASSS